MAKERILNVGCGESRYGTDFIDFYPSRKEVIKCNIDNQKFPYKDGVFDKVVAEFVIAHLTNFSNLMIESRRVLKKGGVLEITTNNAGFWGVFGSAFYGNYERVNGRLGHDADKQYGKISLHLLTGYSCAFLPCFQGDSRRTYLLSQESSQSKDLFFMLLSPK